MTADSDPPAGPADGEGDADGAESDDPADRPPKVDGDAETGDDDAAASLDVDRRTSVGDDSDGDDEGDDREAETGDGDPDGDGDDDTVDADGEAGSISDADDDADRIGDANDDADSISDADDADADGGGNDDRDAGTDGNGAGGDGVGANGGQATPPGGDTQPVPEPVAGDRDGGGDGASSGDAAADGNGAVTAAQKGMEAVNQGVGALGGGVAEGPEEDQEMPLAEHIEEMMRRLGVVFAVAGVVVVAVLLIGTVSPTVPSAAEIIEFLWNAHVGFEQNQPRVYGPLEFLLTKLKVASLAGLLVGLPVFVYETYRFMRPGLYPNERRYYLAAVPTSLVLGLIGVAFAHFIVLPTIFNYFISYTEESAVLAFSLRETFNLILLLMGYMAIVFQIPLFIQLAIMMGLVTREWMEDRRLLFWSAFVGLAFIVSPDPTGMAPIIVGATMIVLFEGTLALLRWTGN